ncbi:MAG: hypothetical protein K0Q66_1106 [Chitinophagaceae bacterium]|jgi:hypothetical protein|nr:hypothetical protein [Chitinophagaceae bacterium]
MIDGTFGFVGTGSYMRQINFSQNLMVSFTQAHRRRHKKQTPPEPGESLQLKTPFGFSMTQFNLVSFHQGKC